MARPIWKGNIVFGLVNIPVELHSAEATSSELSFTMLDSEDKARIRYRKVNDVTGEEVPWDRIVKGYEYEDDSFVILTEEDFKRAAVEATQAIEIEDFVEQDAVPPEYFERPYFLKPGKKGDKGYALLREALHRAKAVGVARVVIRAREHLALVLVHGDAIMLEMLRFQDELRDPTDLELPTQDLKALKISEKEVSMAQALIESMTGEWKPQKYHDKYRESLLKWIQQRVKSGQLEAAPQPVGARDEDDAPAPLNFMALLEKSLKDGKKSGGAKKTSAAPSSRRAPARRTRKAG